MPLDCGIEQTPAPSESVTALVGGPAGEPPEGCPPPLVWQQVVETVRAESDAWQLERDGGVISGRTFGSGPPLYLLGGLAGTQELFFLLMWLLRDDVRCVVYDGPERRDPPKNARRAGKPPQAAAAMAEDLFTVADRHGDRQFSLAAGGFGSLVALTAMLARPQRVERAVLAAGSAHVRLSVFERLLIRLGSRLPGTLNSVPMWPKIAEQNHRRWFPPFDQTRFEFFLENTGRTRLSTLARRGAVFRDSDLRPRLSEIVQPVLLVRAEGDGRTVEQCHRELQQGLPNARTESLHTCGRLPHLTHPHRMAKLVREHLGLED